MDSLANLFAAMPAVMTPDNLVLIFFAGLIGTLVGALPGLGPSSGIALMMPLTFGMSPVSGLCLLTGVYMGTMYGGRITSILLNTPGDAPAIITALEGYPMMQQGRGGLALGISGISSFLGGCLGLLALIFFAPIIAEYAIYLGPPEYTLLMVFGLSMIIALAGDDWLKALIVTAFGVLLSTIGGDYVSGYVRFAYTPEMIEGIDFVAVIIGLYGLGEVLYNIERRIVLDMGRPRFRFSEYFPSLSELKEMTGPTGRGSVIGTVIGLLPGAGPTVATFVSYVLEKKLSRRPETFGHGAIPGLAGPEATNNAAVPGALIPLFALGIPGSGGTAIMLGALIMFGLQPGPMLMVQSADVVWGTIAGLVVANVLLLISNILLIPLFINVLRVSQKHLTMIVVSFCLVGAFVLNYSVFNVGVAVAFGFLGYLMKKADYPIGPFILSLVLAPLLENYFRQSIMLGQGSWNIFVDRPISLVFVVLLTSIVVLSAVGKQVMSRRRKQSAAQG